MKAIISKISGIDDAILSLSYSKRTISDERRQEVRNLCNMANDQNGFMRSTLPKIIKAQYETELMKVIKYGIQHGHETLLSFIDLTIEIDGLHRGAQDDWDAHAYRYHNRIVRSSTRLAKFTGAEKSNFYKGKVLTTEEVLKMANYTIPLSTFHDGNNYDYVEGIGYVREDLVDDKDTLRGLYRLEIPCSNITKCDYRQFRHVYHMRNANSHANPELRDVVEDLRNDLGNKQSILGTYLGKVWGVCNVRDTGGYGGQEEYGYIERTRTSTIANGTLNGLLEGHRG